MELAARRFNLSTRRGAGPPRQSEPLNFELLANLQLGWEPLVVGGPVNTHAIVVLFTFFMVRELEGAVAKVAHLSLDEDELTVTWSLPVSKTDYAATGCKRSWGVYLR